MISYEESVKKIFSLRQLGMKLGLENVKNFLEKLGNPQLKLKTIHVAGSNGKGSTVAFTASILQETGYKVGMFTSPHFVDFTERIKINGKEIEKEFVVDFVNRNLGAIEKKEITFFEITTAMAFEYFYENAVDYAVIETGLGGRLDATNTMNPLAEVITTISLEHTRILGESVKAIAREKAGIIKTNSKVFCGLMPGEAEGEIRKIAEEKNSEFYSLSEFSEIGKEYLKLQFEQGRQIKLYKAGFIGAHQLRNAALAILTLINTLGITDFNILNSGIMNVAQNTGLQGRFEIFSEKPLIVFDAAHNYEGVAIFIEEFLKKYSDNCASKYLIYGALRDKDVKGILKLLKDKFDNVYFAPIDFYRALSVNELIEKAEEVGIASASLLEDAAEFIREFMLKKTDDCLAVIGSIYLLGEIKNNLRG